MKNFILLFTLITFLNNAYSNTVSVGLGSSCTFNDIYTALNSIERGGSIEIELNKQAVDDYVLPATLIIIDRNVTIRGGFNGCGGARDNTEKSWIRMDNNSGSTILVTSFATPTPAIVNLEKIIVYGGQASKGGGIKIGGDNDVRLIDSLLLSNRADYGGGVYIDGTQGAKLSLLNSTIDSNIADQWGGGIYCLNSSITLATSDISNNTAHIHGGGLFLDNCNLNSLDGGDINISTNRADRELDTLVVPIYLDGGQDTSGGGLFAFRGSNVDLGSENTSVYFSNNIAFMTDQRHDQYGLGGGLRVKNSTTNVNLVNTHFIDNLANRGAAINLADFSTFKMTSSGSNCIQNTQSKCSTIINNTAVGYDLGFVGCVATRANDAGQGGAIWSGHGGHILLNGVYVEGNSLTRTDGCTFENNRQIQEGAAFYIGSDVDFKFINSVLTNTTKSIDGSDNDAEAIRVYGKFSAVHSTITDNDDGFEAIIRVGSDEADVEFVNSIWVESQDLYDTDDYVAQIRTECSIVSSISELVNPNGAANISTDTIESSNPGFINSQADDYHLVEDALAVDFCNNDGISSRGLSGLLSNDMDGQSRPIIASTFNATNSFDAGAFENQTGNALAEIDISANISDGDFNYGLNQQVGYSVHLTNHSSDSVIGVGLRIELDTQISLPLTLIANGSYWNCIQQNYSITCFATQSIDANSTYASSLIIAFAGFVSPIILNSSVEILSGNYYLDINDLNNVDTQTTSIAINSDVGVDAVYIPESINPTGSAEFIFAFENYGSDSSINPIFNVKLDHVDADLLISSVPASWDCFVFQDTNDDLKPMMDCRPVIGSSYPVNSDEFSISAVAPSGTPSVGDTFNVILSSSTASNDDNLQNNTMTIEVPLIIDTDTIFINSFEN